MVFDARTHFPHRTRSGGISLTPLFLAGRHGLPREFTPALFVYSCAGS
jgi:hypothetical protein